MTSLTTLINCMAFFKKPLVWDLHVCVFQGVGECKDTFLFPFFLSVVSFRTFG